MTSDRTSELRNDDNAARHRQHDDVTRASGADRDQPVAPMPAPALLAAQSIAGRGNGGVRAAAIQQLQHTHGNRTVQRFLAEAAVQREAAADAVSAAEPASAAPGVPIQRMIRGGLRVAMPRTRIPARRQNPPHIPHVYYPPPLLSDEEEKKRRNPEVQGPLNRALAVNTLTNVSSKANVLMGGMDMMQGAYEGDAAAVVGAGLGMTGPGGMYNLAGSAVNALAGDKYIPDTTDLTRAGFNQLARLGNPDEDPLFATRILGE